MKVIIGSPIRQDPEVLELFLEFLELLEKNNFKVDYYFIDNNHEEKSSQLLNDFMKKNPNTILKKYETRLPYEKDENTHKWYNELIWEVARFKNEIIEYAKNNNYDFLFLVDSDLLLHPKTLIHLINTRKDIISEVFWTKWRQSTEELPQVWMSDSYNFYEARFINAPDFEKRKRIMKFLKKLKKKGIYKVGGLGACTLISKKALLKGVNFSPIYNLSFWGEDRHFCIRAVALGFELYASTFYPPLHIYRKSDLSKVEKFRKEIEEFIKGEENENIRLYNSKK